MALEIATPTFWILRSLCIYKALLNIGLLGQCTCLHNFSILRNNSPRYSGAIFRWYCPLFYLHRVVNEGTCWVWQEGLWSSPPLSVSLSLALVILNSLFLSLFLSLSVSLCLHGSHCVLDD